nr:hypothetical protein CWKEJDCK_CWKEJDCK_CDS_0005 [Microvirus sp.]
MRKVILTIFEIIQIRLLKRLNKSLRTDISTLFKVSGVLLIICRVKTLIQVLKILRRGYLAASKINVLLVKQGRGVGIAADARTTRHQRKRRKDAKLIIKQAIIAFELFKRITGGITHGLPRCRRDNNKAFWTAIRVSPTTRQTRRVIKRIAMLRQAIKLEIIKMKTKNNHMIMRPKSRITIFTSRKKTDAIIFMGTAHALKIKLHITLYKRRIARLSKRQMLIIISQGQKPTTIIGTKSGFQKHPISPITGIIKTTASTLTARDIGILIVRAPHLKRNP